MEANTVQEVIVKLSTRFTKCKKRANTFRQQACEEDKHANALAMALEETLHARCLSHTCHASLNHKFEQMTQELDLEYTPELLKLFLICPKAKRPG